MNLPRFNFPILKYRVIDGDTVEVVCDLGWDATKKTGIRLQGINAPETNRKAERAAGILVEALVEYWLSQFDLEDLIAVSYKKDMFYGRVVGDILYVGDSEEWDESLKEFLVRLNVVDPLTKTGKRKKFTQKRLKQIEKLATSVLKLTVGPALRAIAHLARCDGSAYLDGLAEDYDCVAEVHWLLVDLDLVHFFNPDAETAEWFEGSAQLTDKGKEWLKKAPK